MLRPSIRHAAATAREESGAVLLTFALFLSVFVLLMAFVLDLGVWFQHHRHLQVQADAAAFAAAGRLTYPCTPTGERAVYQTAGQYGGVGEVVIPNGKTETSASPLYNAQVGEAPKTQGTVHEEINKKSYFGQSAADNTVEKAPCEAGMIDVKMTEAGSPGLFSNIIRKAFSVPNINAHARVSVVQQQYASFVEPLIESEPVEVRVFYLNDTTCESPAGSKKYIACADGQHSNFEQQQLATGLLEDVGSNEEKGTIKFTDGPSAKTVAPVPVNITAEHIGIRIALGGKKGALQGAGNETVAVCNHEYVECFSEDTGIVGPLVNISGYSAEGEGTAEPLAPKVHKVSLSTPSPNTCTDGYLSNYHAKTKGETCSFTINADVKYGKQSATETGIKVVPELVYTEGFTGGTKTEKAPALKLNAEGVWTGAASLPSWYYGNYGSVEVNLAVTCEKIAKSPCEKASKNETATIKDVQRIATTGPDGSNRIVGLTISEPGAGNPAPGEHGANAYEKCETADANKCEHKLAVTLELTGSLEDAKKYANGEGKPIPPFHIVYADNDQEDDDQFVVSCPPTTSSSGAVAAYQEALAHGCTGKYGVNTHAGSCVAEKSIQEKLEAEEKAQEKARKTEEEGRKARETTEAAERTKWATEEKETILTKKQREEKEATQKTSREKIEGEEKTLRTGWEKVVAERKKAREEKEATQTAGREKLQTEEQTAKTTWEKEEKETLITVKQREEKESTQKKARETTEAKEAEERAGWKAEEEKAKGKKITKKEREEKEATQTTARKARETKEAEERAKWTSESTTFKLTKKEREEKEATQKKARETREAKEAEERAKWSSEEKTAQKEREEKEATQKIAREAREAVEKSEREQWTNEEKTPKLTKKQREEKETAQKVAREKTEAKEAEERAKREKEEQATKEGREKSAASAHECVGLVSVQNQLSKNHPEDEIALSATFQNYFLKRIERPVNGLRFECPNRWRDNNEGGIPIVPANDSRLIQLFVVPFTVTDFERKNEVSPLVPIENFATFYVTGWANGNTEAGQINSSHPEWNPKERRDECSEKLFKKLPKAEQEELENEAVPLKQREQKEKEKGFDDDAEQPREILGHLIKYVNVLDEAPGTVPCKLEGLETCEATLTE